MKFASQRVPITCVKGTAAAGGGGTTCCTCRCDWRCVPSAAQAIAANEVTGAARTSAQSSRCVFMVMPLLGSVIVIVVVAVVALLLAVAVVIVIVVIVAMLLLE